MLSKRLIEDQFPVSKVSKESYKERKAGSGQTLTGLGKWWGRKPLVLVRAALIAMLMPASDDPDRDREIFLKIMTMEEEGLWRRKNKPLGAQLVYENLDRSSRGRCFDAAKRRVAWSKSASKDAKESLERQAFARLGYDEKLKYCVRPEQIDGPSDESWKEINAHLGTSAEDLVGLVQQLGKNAFGKVPRVGDVFCGGGSVPFEAARLGCEAYGSDLSPVAALLTWAAVNLIGGGEEVQAEVRSVQEEAYRQADRQITEWGIEHNAAGWRADAYLYCVEARSPATGLWVPLAPSWVISEKYRVVAVLRRNDARNGYDIDIVEGADEATYRTAQQGTFRSSRLVCPETGEEFSIATIRGDRKGPNGETVTGLRRWDNEDLVPRPEDVFQERLYCIRWVEQATESGQAAIRRHYRAPDEADLQREKRVLELLKERFSDWQEKGYIPSLRIEPGDKTDEPIRTRGWTHWHHLFHPRQLLVHGLFNRLVWQPNASMGARMMAFVSSMGVQDDMNSRLCHWTPQLARSGGAGAPAHTFTNQALNTQYNYPVRGLTLSTQFLVPEFKSIRLRADCVAEPKDARSVRQESQIWITDPPYADAINYHELGEFFLAWYQKHLPKAFPEWYSDSKRALAVQGSGEDFKRSMVEIYRNLTDHMPDDGLQLVMFTHQDAAVWADLAMILWAAGMRVTTAWTIATETPSGLKKGNYVQGTVLLVLRKRQEQTTAFTDELYPLVEDEVRRQLDHMTKVDDDEDPNFADTDYQLAAYAAALRVLTGYSEIEGHDVEHELFRARKAGEKSEFEKIIDRAVEIACDHLVPSGFDRFQWRSLSSIERLYLKGLELERHLEMRAGAYQELAKGFGVKEYKFLYAKSEANAVRFKTPGEFKKAMLGKEGFGATLLRNILYAVAEVARTEDVQDGIAWLKSELSEYWVQRTLIVSLLRYLGQMASVRRLEHWTSEAAAADRLAGAVQADYVRD